MTEVLLLVAGKLGSVNEEISKDREEKMHYYKRITILKNKDFKKFYTEINSKWMKVLNVSSETKKLLPKIGSKLCDFSLIFFLDRFPQTREMKAKINKGDTEGNHQ